MTGASWTGDFPSRGLCFGNTMAVTVKNAHLPLLCPDLFRMIPPFTTRGRQLAQVKLVDGHGRGYVHAGCRLRTIPRVRTAQTGGGDDGCVGAWVRCRVAGLRR